MAKTSRRAGQNVRSLALKRRARSVQAFIAAGLVIILPVALSSTLKNFSKQVIPSRPGVVQPATYLYLVLIIAAIGFIAQGIQFWKLANRADQGAKGEEDIAKDLLDLERQGWQIEYGTLLKRGGDVDIICTSPNQKAFVVDVKSHRGNILYKGEQLYRQMGTQKLTFEKDFLKAVMQQACQVKDQKGFRFVTPILVFSRGKVLVSEDKVKGVYLVERAKLVQLLKNLG